MVAHRELNALNHSELQDISKTILLGNLYKKHISPLN